MAELVAGGCSRSCALDRLEAVARTWKLLFAAFYRNHPASRAVLRNGVDGNDKARTGCGPCSSVKSYFLPVKNSYG